PQITGNSQALRRVLSLMESAVDSAITVLLEGETGVGKEIIASAIHANSPRAKAPFVTVNCGALPGPLLESELFGFARGAFTGATREKPGLFEAADRGTLFLDEIGDTPPELQVKLLRVLQEGELRRLGETRSRRVDVRVISATNRDLEAEVSANNFREDLFYRLSVFPIRVPPLRERREDIPLLTTVLLERISKRLQRPVGSLTARALDHLTRHQWPGNIRELENELERAVALTAPSMVISHECLSDRVLTAAAGSRLAGATSKSEPRGNLKAARQAFEREFVATVLDQHGGNATRAARELGISRQMLQRKIRDWDLRKLSGSRARR
ncbi:MAG: sigma-54 dependent transcriptional regulator, partial [Myxococcota bacterium]